MSIHCLPSEVLRYTLTFLSLNDCAWSASVCKFWSPEVRAILDPLQTRKFFGIIKNNPLTDMPIGARVRIYPSGKTGVVAYPYDDSGNHPSKAYTSLGLATSVWSDPNPNHNKIESRHEVIEIDVATDEDRFVCAHHSNTEILHDELYEYIQRASKADVVAIRVLGVALCEGFCGLEADISSSGYLMAYAAGMEDPWAMKWQAQVIGESDDGWPPQPPGYLYESLRELEKWNGWLGQVYWE